MNPGNSNETDNDTLTHGDPYYGVTESTPLRLIAAALFITILTAGNTLVMGLMWYEKHGRDQPRSLINQLTFRVYFFVILGNFTLLALDYVRIITAVALPNWLCEVKVQVFRSFERRPAEYI